MSATGFHPEPSAKAPWTRTTVLTAACAGHDTAKAAPVRRARLKRFSARTLRRFGSGTVIVHGPLAGVGQRQYLEFVGARIVVVCCFWPLLAQCPMRDSVEDDRFARAKELRPSKSLPLIPRTADAHGHLGSSANGAGKSSTGAACGRPTAGSTPPAKRGQAP